LSSRNFKQKGPHLGLAIGVDLVEMLSR